MQAQTQFTNEHERVKSIQKELADMAHNFQQIRTTNQYIQDRADPYVWSTPQTPRDPDVWSSPSPNDMK